MIDFSQYARGRKASGPTPHLPSMAAYDDGMIFTDIPATIDWTNGTELTMLGNDVVGLCTVAAAMHYVQTAERWRDGVGRIGSTAMAIGNYSALSGYEPGKSVTDTGATISSMLQRWCNQGFQMPGGVDLARGVVRVDPANRLHMRAALHLFGPLILGVKLPIAAQRQPVWPTPGNLTDDTNQPGGWDEHCLTLNAWTAQNFVKLGTWGRQQIASAGWLSAYCDEAWAVLHPTWLASGRAPNGVLANQIIADMPKLAA